MEVVSTALEMACFRSQKHVQLLNSLCSSLRFPQSLKSGEGGMRDSETDLSGYGRIDSGRASFMSATSTIPSKVSSVLRPHSTEITQVVASPFSPDVFVTSSSDTTSKVFNHGNAVSTISSPTTKPLTCCDAHDASIVVGCVDKSVRLYSESGGRARVTMQGHGGKVVDVGFVGGVGGVVSASQDRSLKVWDVKRSGTMVSSGSVWNQQRPPRSQAS